jgi:hypothetical protein
VLRRFLLHLATDNVRAIEELLREDVVALNDPGEFVAARKAVVGRAKVALFHRKITRLVDAGEHGVRLGIADLNGLPALVFVYEPTRSDFAPRQVFRVELDRAGKIRQLHAVLASAKLGRVRFDELRGMTALQRLTSHGLRGAFTRLQPRAQRLSRHIQVHSRSRARR